MEKLTTITPRQPGDQYSVLLPPLLSAANTRRRQSRGRWPRRVQTLVESSGVVPGGRAGRMIQRQDVISLNGSDDDDFLNFNDPFTF